MGNHRHPSVPYVLLVLYLKNCPCQRSQRPRCKPAPFRNPQSVMAAVQTARGGTTDISQTRVLGLRPIPMCPGTDNGSAPAKAPLTFRKNRRTMLPWLPEVRP